MRVCVHVRVCACDRMGACELVLSHLHTTKTDSHTHTLTHTHTHTHTYTRVFMHTHDAADKNLMESGEWDFANRAKHLLEEGQRYRRRQYESTQTM